MDKKIEDMEEESNPTDTTDKEESDSKESAYIAGDDWVIPIEFEEDVSNKDIIFRIKKKDGEIVFEDESINHTGKEVIFDVPRSLNKKLEAGEYKWMSTLVDQDTGKRSSTKPGCFYVESF